MLNGKKIIIGITGGIAAYKTISLIRLFNKNGAEVKVVTAHNALQFVTKVSLESISKNKVYSDLFSSDNDFTTEHIALTDWGDVFIVAPATANIIGKFANAIADDAISTTLLAFDKKVYLAPAMNCKMWEHFSVKKNCDYLIQNNIAIIEPTDGFLACGYEGKGRMAEPEEIFNFVLNDSFSNSQVLKNVNVLITAGPTHESIDPVRFIGNHSSGLMGYSLAEAFACKGANVTLISGPTHLKAKHNNIKTIHVVSADEMNEACTKEFPKNSIAVMSAAVADYKPAKESSTKIKKGNAENITLQLTSTPDILLNLSKMKKKNQILAGFALETNNEIANAQEKLKKKKLDFIVLNSLNDKGAGFKTSTNKVSIIDSEGVITFELKSKKEVAEDIINKILSILKDNKN